MQAAAHRGPIAVINVSKYCCDVILVEEQQIRSLGLTGLNYKDVTEKVQGSDLASPEVSRWLWDAVGNPILNALGFTRHLSVNNWPHVWWIPTGALIRLPPPRGWASPKTALNQCSIELCHPTFRLSRQS